MSPISTFCFVLFTPFYHRKLGTCQGPHAPGDLCFPVPTTRFCSLPTPPLWGLGLWGWQLAWAGSLSPGGDQQVLRLHFYPWGFSPNLHLALGMDPVPRRAPKLVPVGHPGTVGLGPVLAKQPSEWISSADRHSIVWMGWCEMGLREWCWQSDSE